MGYGQLRKEEIKMTVTSVHKGRMAPRGCVFYVATVKYGGMIYSQYTPVYRGHVDEVKEAEGKQKFIDTFFEELKTKLNQPVKRKALVDQE